ncbi:chalcone-flavanone isomerase [Pyrrhoderma noxium]|uniref:Chalcone-flavanone isomerase n=1 Tax=Pyrrhoderma noxium TaxID=2282107 RepID=A0A286UQP8_9AGAM|nr:chalcone-flavanone isomerase [Pyrrhoderma noxium]
MSTRNLSTRLLTTARKHYSSPARFRHFSSYAPASGSRVTWRHGLGLFATVTAATLAVTLQVKSTVHLDAQPDSLLGPNPSTSRKDEATGIEFPETLVIPSRVRLPPFNLVGLGVRTVSFIGIKVYSIAFYADLSNPSLKIPEDASPDEKIEYIISNTACVLRIIPTRNTSFSHLRDGFIRSLQAHMSLQLKNGKISAQEAEEAQSPLRKLKSMFPSTPLKKGEPLDILLLPPPKNPEEKRSLVIRDLGSVECNWVSKQFLMVYFTGDGLSPPMKKSVVNYLQGPIELIKS